MPFSYYYRLSPGRQAIYRASDRVTEVRLRIRRACMRSSRAFARALAADNKRRVQSAAAALSDALLAQLGVCSLEVKVLAVRPRGRWGELHGLYTYGEKAPPRIKLWMRTARQREVVAFRTFLRTLLHEVGHHLDYHFLKLPRLISHRGLLLARDQPVPPARSRRAHGTCQEGRVDGPQAEGPGSASGPPAQGDRPAHAGRLPFED